MYTRPKLRIALALGVVLSAVPALAAPPTGSARETPAQSLLAVQQSRQREAAAVRDVIGRLKLTEQQARQLLGPAAEAAKLHVEAYEADARLQPEMLKVFAEFAAEDSLDQGFSPAVEKRTARLTHEAKTTDERITARMIELEKQVVAILTPAQQQIIREVAAKPQVKHKAQGSIKEHPELLRGRAAREAAAAQKNENDPLTLAHKAMAELQRKIHPELGPSGRKLLHPAASAVLCQITGAVPNEAQRRAAEMFERGSADYPLGTCIRQQAELSKLRAQISNWNLINGLHLNGPQITKITALYDAAAGDLKPLSRPGHKQRSRENEREREARVQLERSVEQVLNYGQRRVLAEFKPCLIPPKNLRDPVRVGQASDHSQQENWLSQARKMSKPRLKQSINTVLEVEAKHFGELDERSRAARAALLSDVAHEAAKMSDVEFEINKADLAERITPPDRIMQWKEKIAALARSRDLPSTVSQFILNEGFVDQLRIRGRQLATGLPTKPIGPTAKAEKPGKSE